jgi:LDH2 family malate/lactate/ureidoglycolate dehydrogenase
VADRFFATDEATTAVSLNSGRGFEDTASDEGDKVMGETKGKETIVAGHGALTEFCTRVFQKLGMPDEEACIAADAIVGSNLRGVDTHGVIRMLVYSAKLKGGFINPRPTVRPLRETKGTALIDGGNGFGQVVGYRAMQTAIRKAREVGVSCVSVRNSNHFGTCAHYSMMALPQNMIGFAFTNASAQMAPTGGAEKILANNPWSVAVPACKRFPVVLDMANSVVARGKIRMAAKERRPIPPEWAVNKEGEPTTDPKAALEGFLLPIGGYKGYGITLMVDLLTGVLANSSYGPRVQGLDIVEAIGGVSHTFMAIDIAAFDDVSEFKARMDAYIDEIKGSKRAKGVDVIYLPGEPEFLKEQERRKKGIPIHINVVKDLRKIADEAGVRFPY